MCSPNIERCNINVTAVYTVLISSTYSHCWVRWKSDCKSAMSTAPNLFDDWRASNKLTDQQMNMTLYYYLQMNSQMQMREVSLSVRNAHQKKEMFITSHLLIFIYSFIHSCSFIKHNRQNAIG